VTARDYQQQIHDTVFETWKTRQSCVVVAATGTGKTVVFSSIVKTAQPKRAMVLCHRMELITQAKDKIETFAGLPVEIEQADLRASTSLFHRTPVVVSSIQTQISGKNGNKRYMRFDPGEFGVLICDEAHRAAAASWREVIAHYRKNPDLRVLGVTATPDRADSKDIRAILGPIVYDYGILQAIGDGWLVDIVQQYVTVADLDFSHVRTSCAEGGLNLQDLEKVMEAETAVQGICQPTLEAIHGLPPKTLCDIPSESWKTYLSSLGRIPRRTIVFTVSVAQAELCASVFARAMDGVEWVCGKTPDDKRLDILTRFKRGRAHVVMNCGVLLEGFDAPDVELISVARPTSSRALYCQMIGRGTRPLAGLVDPVPTADGRRAAIQGSPKPFVRILDFVGNSGKHKLVSCVDVLGGKVSEAAVESARRKAQKEGKPVRILVTMTNAQLEVERKKREAAERLKRIEEDRKKNLLARVNYGVQTVNAFDGADVWKGSGLAVSRDGRQFSEKQVRILRREGYDPSRFKYRQGQAIIGKLLDKWFPNRSK
jgi:superfamily II DNA or RNA helicase